MNANLPDASSPSRADTVARRIEPFIASRLKEMASRLVDQGGLDPETGNELRALESLSRLTRHHLSPPPKRDYLVLSFIAVTIIIVGGLSFARWPSVAAEIEVESSTVSFVTASPTRISGLTSLLLLQATVFADTEIEEPRRLRTFPLASPLELRPIDKLGTLSLGSLTLPAETRVSIERATDAGTWKITLEGREVGVAATLGGKVNLAARDLPQGAIDFGRGARMVLQASDAASPRIEFYVAPRETSSFLMSRPIEITAISFEERMDEASGTSLGMMTTHASSVLSGDVYNETMRGQKSVLRKRERIELSLAKGRVRELRLEPSTLRVSASVAANEFDVGGPGSSRTLRPTILEWLATHYTVQLAWGSGVWLFGLILGGARWWRAGKDS